MAGKLRAATLGELMVPIEMCRPALHGDVLTPGVLLLTRYDNDPIALFGSGEEKKAVFLGTSNRFEAMPVRDESRWGGLAFEELAIEVDETSLFRAENVCGDPGSLVLVEDRAEMIVVDRGRFSRGDVYRVVVRDGLPTPPAPYEIGFRKWCLVKRDGDRVIFSHEIVAEPLEG